MRICELRRRMVKRRLRPVGSLEEAVTFGRHRQAAGLAPPKPLQTVAGNPVIADIADPLGNDSEDPGQRERESQQAQHPEHGGRAQENRAILPQDDRSRSAFGQACVAGKRRAGCGLTRSETKNVAAVEPKQEIDPTVAKQTFSVENHNGMMGQVHSSFSRGWAASRGSARRH
jgi:hypothetical protein